MIQRIQSLYLLLVAAAMLAVAAMPLGVLEGDGWLVRYTAFDNTAVNAETATAFPVWLLGYLAGLSALVALITVFLFKQRERQTTLCLVNGFLIGLFYVAYAVFFFSVRRGVDVDFAPGLSIGLPLVALLFNTLAMKAVSRDIALLASLDRLR